MGPEIAIILSGALAASFVAGAAGFGDALVAAAIWLQFFQPSEAVPLIVACFFAMHAVMLVLMKGRLDFRHLWPFVIGGAVGVPIGAQLLKVIDPATFKLVAGAGLIVYGSVMLMLANLPVIKKGGRPLDGLVGWIGGVLGGFAGLSGFIPAIWCTQRGWARAQARGVTQPYILTMHGMALGWLAAGGMVTSETGTRFAIAVPAIALGAWIGIRLYGHFDDKRFRQCVLGLLIGAGALLLLNPGGR
ncbi:MAG: sulfite exporter TauE/SafE family protein [Rhodospirillales bacterium]|nr:sulfite exporter TauE/SafE family protein [Rhodospirillales bacterium]